MSRNIKFANLLIDVEERPNEVIYTFDGDVDENFRHQEVAYIEKQNIIFDLEKVRNFNSCGIREWIAMIKVMNRMGHLLFRKCSVTMVDQINMVPDSLGLGTVESFYAPYYCECGGEINRLIEVFKNISLLQKHSAPVFQCEKCGKKLEFDALEESYFLFINSALPKVG
jgi:hypothetical protein